MQNASTVGTATQQRNTSVMCADVSSRVSLGAIGVPAAQPVPRANCIGLNASDIQMPSESLFRQMLY